MPLCMIPLTKISGIATAKIGVLKQIKLAFNTSLFTDNLSHNFIIIIINNNNNNNNNKEILINLCNHFGILYP